MDLGRLIQSRAEIQRRVSICRLRDRLARRPDLPANAVVRLVQSPDEAGDVLSQIGQLVDETSEPLVHARLYKLAQLVKARHPDASSGRLGLDAGGLEQAAAAAVARSVAQQVELPSEPRPAAILHDQVCWVTCPARLDFCGGWSDTPPICTELGGTVVNAAVTLNGQYPVQVVAKLSDRPSILLRSIDLGEQVEVCDTASALRYTDPGDWASLPKAALVAGGIVPSDPAVPLSSYLDTLGGGLDISLFSALPKGSGLGTSSILGSALLACLARVVGETLGLELLIRRTSLLEQLLTTGGGWQDQIGGITPGAKIIRTRPGADQTPSIFWTPLDLSPSGLLHDRILLYYTGQKRLAKNILQNVVGRYLARDPELLRLVAELKASSEKMKDDIDRGDMEAFARGVDHYWSLKKRIDPGSTNDQIEQVIRAVDEHIAGKVMCGAGGGGFLLLITRSAESTRKVREILSVNPPNRGARFFAAALDQAGLRVTVL